MAGHYRHREIRFERRVKLTYDPDANIAYIRLREPVGEVEARQIGEDIVLDVDGTGQLVGIELLNANEQLGAADEGRFVFIDPRDGQEHTLKVA